MTTVASAITFAPPPPVDDTVQIRDFTIKEKRVAFRVDDDVFEAYGLLGITLMQDLVEAAKGLGKMIENKNYDGITGLFSKILYPQSAERFNARVVAVGDEAIDVKRQLIPILYYLLESYGVRPTQPSSSSSAGSPSGTGGTTSTPGSSTEVTT